MIKNTNGNIILKIILLGAGFLVLAAGAYMLFTPRAKVSQKFINKYNEAASLNSEMFKALENDLSAMEQIDQKEKVKDYNGIGKIVDDALVQTSSAAGKVDLHKQRVSELRSLSSKISDPEVKNKSLTLIGFMEEEDTHLTKGFDDLKQLLGLLRSYYSGLAAGSNPSFPASTETLISQTNAESKIIVELSDKIVSARDDFFKAAGLEVDDTSTPSTETPTK